MPIMIDDHCTQIHKTIISFSPKTDSQILLRCYMRGKIRTLIPALVINLWTKEIDNAVDILLSHTVMGIGEVNQHFTEDFGGTNCSFN